MNDNIAERDAALARAERAEIERDAAINVVENIQGKVAMYAGKFEMEKREREKAERERDWLINLYVDYIGPHDTEEEKEERRERVRQQAQEAAKRQFGEVER